MRSLRVAAVCLTAAFLVLSVPLLAFAQNTESCGWEDGTSTVLGSFGSNLVDVANVGAPNPVHTGNRSLTLTESPHTGTPQAYIAFIQGLSNGDQVTASFWAFDTTASSPSLRIWAHYAYSGDVNSYAGSASGPSAYSSGIGWEQLSYTWTFDSTATAGDAMMIECRLYSTPSTCDSCSTQYWIDDVSVTAPGTASIVLPCAGGNPYPSFASTQRTPCVPFPGNSVTVDARVTAATGANLHYFVNGGAENVLSMSPVATSGDTTTFEAVIPSQPNNGDRVRYYTEAFNANPDTTQYYERGYFVGTVGMGSLRAANANGVALYRFYGVRVHGNVTVPYGVYQTSNTDYYVQDATGALNVFQYGTHTVQPGLGDDITVEGVLDQYNGKLEVTTGAGCDTLLVDVNGPGTPPAPKVVTTCDNFEDFENELIEFKIATLPTSPDTLLGTGTGVNYPITNCYDDTSMVMRIDADTNIGGTVTTSNVIDVVGIASQFDSITPYFSGYQIIPRFASDITFLTSTGVGERNGGPVARLMQNFPNPFGRTTSISYTVPKAAQAGAGTPVRLTVFDLQGRVVATLVNGLKESGDHSVNLDSGALSKVGNGIYFYRLEVGSQTFTRKLVFIR